MKDGNVLTETDSRPDILERLAVNAVVVTAGTKDAVVACVLETGLCRQVCGAVAQLR